MFFQKKNVCTLPAVYGFRDFSTNIDLMCPGKLFFPKTMRPSLVRSVFSFPHQRWNLTRFSSTKSSSVGPSHLAHQDERISPHVHVFRCISPLINTCNNISVKNRASDEPNTQCLHLPCDYRVGTL
jgi:hypothetical protein